MMAMFRYRKNGRTRTYNLRVLSEDKSELWVASEGKGTVRNSRKLVTFDNPDDVDPFLREVERELRMGGWSEI